MKGQSLGSSLPQTVAGLLQPQAVMALCDSLAGPLLAQPVPQDPTALAGGSERYAVARGVAVVPVRGILSANSGFADWFGWATYHGLADTCTQIGAAEDVAAVVLELDSPGGYVTGIQAAAEAIASLAALKPVTALINPLAASAAYWLACQASEVVMTPGASAGSIGTALMTGSYVQPGGNGMQVVEMASSHARAKRPDAATEAGRAELQRSLDTAEAEFLAAVASGRGISVADLLTALSVTEDPRDGGAVFGPADAVARGLADRIETRAACYDRIFAAHAPQVRTASRASMGGGYAARAAAAQALASL
jgi:capsid assembly protease